MTSDQIKEVALKHFAQSGYEGASLAHIADKVGIKKQSIYTHFKGKDVLFLQICKDTREKELAFVKTYIEKNTSSPINEFLFNFLLQFIDRYNGVDSTKFWIRTAFFPPAHLYDPVMKGVYEYLDQVEEQLIPFLEKAMKEGTIDPTVGSKRATAAFLGVLDGIFVEMLYGGPVRLQKRLDASWHIYWRGLSNE